jgi:hypothetical protein
VILRPKRDFFQRIFATFLFQILAGPKMSPVHLAAINPYKKGKVLDQMLLLDGSTVSKEDGHRRQPIHFAAGDL